MANKSFFLPYQIAWLNSTSKIKLWEKSRRIGATWTQSFEDVQDVARKTVPAVFFSSSDEDAAKAYIDYCEYWLRALNVGVKSIGEDLFDSENDITSLKIELRNGTQINALSSNPKRFRSKGGKVVLDEFAHHQNQAQLWKAARPVITWNYPLRILSTHNGVNSVFNQFIKSIQKGDLGWHHQYTDIFQAVEAGLVDKIYGRKTTKQERKDWIEAEREDCFNEDTWQEEYCCNPVEENRAFLTYDLIRGCEDDSCILPLENITGDFYVGMDIGRVKDLSVIWILERVGNRFFTRQIFVLQGTPFSHQREQLFHILRHKKFRRACIDATGLGMQFAEEAQEEFGKYRVEAVTFTNKLKEEMAYTTRTKFEDRHVIVPSRREIREDLHSLRRVTTAAGNIRFDVENTEKAKSHADYFWGLSLAIHAGDDQAGPLIVRSRRERETARLTKGFETYNLGEY